MVAVLWFLQRKFKLWKPQTLWDPFIIPAFSASTRHCWVKSFKVWWFRTEDIETPWAYIIFCASRDKAIHGIVWALYGPQDRPSNQFDFQIAEASFLSLHSSLVTIFRCSWTGATNRTRQSSKVSIAPTSSSGRMTVVGMLLSGLPNVLNLYHNLMQTGHH